MSDQAQIFNECHVSKSFLWSFDFHRALKLSYFGWTHCTEYRQCNPKFPFTLGDFDLTLKKYNTCHNLIRWHEQNYKCVDIAILEFPTQMCVRQSSKLTYSYSNRGKVRGCKATNFCTRMVCGFWKWAKWPGWIAFKVFLLSILYRTEISTLQNTETKLLFSFRFSHFSLNIWSNSTAESQ